MARKAGDDKVSKVIKALSSGLLSKLADKILDNIKGMFGRMEDIIYSTEKKIMEILFSSILFIVGIIFVSVAVIYLIIEYLALSRGWSFLIIGLVLIIWSMIIKMKLRR